MYLTNLFIYRYVRRKKGYPKHIGLEWLKCGNPRSMVGGLTVGGLTAGGLTAGSIDVTPTAWAADP